jgi:hypothetical protein
MYNGIVQTPLKPRILVLKGLLPLFMYSMMFVLIFGFTDWAWTHAVYVTIMVCPVVSLINSRHIVCNVANQKMDCLPKTTLWYLLFPLNRLLPSLITSIPTHAVSLDNTKLVFEEKYVALIVFILTALWYLHFAIGTIK